jgi:dolichol-phosphate mannosyltransferase
MTEASRGERTLICIPTYNERDNLEKIVPAVIAQLPLAHVLVVDDASPDGTGDLADGMAAADERVHVLHRAAKQGLGRAYLDAFDWALERDYSRVVEFDADFSHDPAYLPEMIERLERADVVVGSRRVRGGGVENWPAFRRLISWMGSVYARLVLGVGIRDLTGGFNGFNRDALERIGLEEIRSSGYAFQIELKHRAVLAGLGVEEMPIVFRDREEGISKMNGGIMAEAMFGVVGMRLRSVLFGLSSSRRARGTGRPRDR